MIREVKKPYWYSFVPGSERERERGSKELRGAVARSCGRMPVLTVLGRSGIRAHDERNKKTMRALELPPKALVDPRSEIPRPLPFDALIPMFRIRVVAFSPTLASSSQWYTPSSPVGAACIRGPALSQERALLGVSQEPDEASVPSSPASLRK
jgi:hypothetical protein